MYSLLRSCNIVRKTDDSAGRMMVFKSVLRNSRKIRYSYTLYQHAPSAVKAALIVLYGLKCYLSLAWGEMAGSNWCFLLPIPRSGTS